MKHPLTYWSLLGLACLTLSACRLPKFFIPAPDTVLMYDTSQEREIAGKPEPAPDSFAYDYRWRYRDSLAEPVSVVSWEQEIESQWDVMYATNRRPQPEGSHVSFDKAWDRNLHLGRCRVTLSHQEPEIKEPKNEIVAKVTKVLPASWQQEVLVEEDQMSQLNSVSPLADEAFFGQLRQQVQSSRQKDLLLYVHGFNVDFKAAVTRLAQISRDLPFNGAIVAYSWPSQGGVPNYLQDGVIVDESVAPFTQFLTQLFKELPAETKIHIVVHSMGNRLVLRSLAKLSGQFGERKPLKNIVLCAPDVGVAEFKKLGPKVAQLAERTTMYTCINDSALIASSKLNQEDRAGSTLPPTVISEIETVECAVLDTSLMGHSYYGSNHSILRDLFCVIKEQRGVDERTWLKSQKIPMGGTYWMFAKFPLAIRWTWHFDADEAATGHIQAAHSETAVLVESGETSE